MTSEYLTNIGIQISIYLILAQSLNLTFGKGKLLNLAHIACFAIGAYATAILSTTYTLGTISCLIISALIAGLLAIFIGAISLRLSRDYFAIGSLAFAAIVQSLLVNWKELTRGTLGITGIPRPEIFGIDFYNNINFLIFTFLIAVIANLILYLVFYGRIGRLISAQAEFEQAATSLGVNNSQIKNIAFLISAMQAGIAGSLFAYYVNFIDPSSFTINEMMFVLAAVVAGKPGSFWGVIFATLLLMILPEPIRFLELHSSLVGPVKQLIHACVLFTIIYIYKDNLFPIERKV